ncbi:MAG: hypothetical protein N3F10_07360 [Candidatus Bathyarchaeota archaeon]|nr:hypothetical protein [Candidatus Bathyarchaeota archaeon]
MLDADYDEEKECKFKEYGSFLVAGSFGSYMNIKNRQDSWSYA